MSPELRESIITARAKVRTLKKCQRPEWPDGCPRLEAGTVTIFAVEPCEYCLAVSNLKEWGYENA